MSILFYNQMDKNPIQAASTYSVMKATHRRASGVSFSYLWDHYVQPAHIMVSTERGTLYCTGDYYIYIIQIHEDNRYLSIFASRIAART